MIYAHIDRALDGDEVQLPAAVSESKAPTLKRISDRHRRLARLIAEGISEGEAAIACGFTASRVSILKADPSFKELVAFYRGTIEESFRELGEKLSVMTGIAADEVIQRLEDDPDSFETDQLLKIVTTGADRLGFSPKTSGGGDGLTVNLAIRLKQASERIKTIDGSARRIDNDE